MTATLPNRIAGHFAPTPPPVPDGVADRESLYHRAVLGAVAFLAGRLCHPDAAVAERAALVLIDLEKTRLRHGRKVAGTAESPCETFERPLPSIAPIAADRDPDRVESDEDDFEEGEFEDDENEEFDEGEDAESDEVDVPTATNKDGANLPPGCRMIAGHVWTPQMLLQLDVTMGQYCEARNQDEKRLRNLADQPEASVRFLNDSPEHSVTASSRPSDLPRTP